VDVADLGDQKRCPNLKSEFQHHAQRHQQCADRQKFEISFGNGLLEFRSILDQQAKRDSATRHGGPKLGPRQRRFEEFGTFRH
jgi:hypothetical protein